MRSALFWVVTWRIVVIPFGRFGTTYRSREGAARKIKQKGGQTPQRGETGVREGEKGEHKCPETSVRNYHNALRNDGEQLRSHGVGHSKMHHRRAHISD